MASTPIHRVVGRGVYVAGNDIDTDRIIPARFLKCVTFDELGPALFRDERFTAAGDSKSHVLDAPQHRGASVLITDRNFGCGSSREHAPQAIRKFGLNAVIAGSFAEIFHGNCTTLGIPCLVVADDDRKRLIRDVQENPDEELICDIENLQVTFANNIYKAQMKASAREAFLAAAYDPLDTLLAGADDVRKVAAALDY